MTPAGSSAQRQPPALSTGVVLVSPSRQAQKGPDFDALAVSFGALSAAIAFGSVSVGLLAVGITIAWNLTTKAAAIAAARDEAERRVAAFLKEEVPQRIERVAREHLAAGFTNTGIVSARGVASGSSRAEAASESEPEEEQSP